MNGLGRLRASGQPSAPALERTLPLAAAAFWIAWFSWREMARRRRLLAVAAVMLVPVACTVAWRLLGSAQLFPANVMLANLSMLYLTFLTVLVSLAFGITAVGEEIEEGTIIYYWTRPIGRSAIYIGRLVAAQTVAAALLALSLAACFVVMTVGNSGVVTSRFVELYARSVAVVTLGCAVYTAIFAAMGAGLRRPLIAALIYAFGWEAMTGLIPARVQQLTVVFHLRNLVRNTEAGTSSFPNLLLELLRQLRHEAPLPEWRSLVTLLLVMVVVTGLGAWLLRRKEIFR
mgnify:CR=1 FL=1